MINGMDGGRRLIQIQSLIVYGLRWNWTNLIIILIQQFLFCQFNWRERERKKKRKNSLVLIHQRWDLNRPALACTYTCGHSCRSLAHFISPGYRSTDAHRFNRGVFEMNLSSFNGTVRCLILLRWINCFRLPYRVSVQRQKFHRRYSSSEHIHTFNRRTSAGRHFV